MTPVLLDYNEVTYALSIMEPAIRDSAHKHNLPYMPLMPSLRAYALIKAHWPSFVHEYRCAVIRAARSGQGYAYID
jgi:hypothetical protein